MVETERPPLEGDPTLPRHEDYIRRAIALAADHSTSGLNGPFGAVVVRKDRIVGEGWNRVVETRDPTAHAEIMAIREACRRLNTHVLADCSIYSSSEPCPMCLSAIHWARIPKVYFSCSAEDAEAAGFDDTKIFVEMGREWDQRRLEGHQLLREEGLKVFAEWAQNPDRIPY